MIDSEAAAESLWGPTPKGEEPQAQPANALNAKERAQAERLYPTPKPPPVANDVPPEVQALRDGDISRELFSVQKEYAEAIKADDFSKLNLPDAGKTALAAEMREIFADVGIGPSQAQEIMMLARMKPPTPEAAKQWEKDAEDFLLARNNLDPKAAEVDLALARSLLRRDPRLERALELLRATHLGNHPRVVELILDAARAEKMAGRLR